jgi:hypothetical protein
MGEGVVKVICLLHASLLALGLAGCATGFENMQAPPFNMTAATAQTDDQAKATLTRILTALRERNKVAATYTWRYENWAANPVILTPPMCEEILGYQRTKKIAFENLEFAYAPQKEGMYAVFSVFTDFTACSDRPRGQLYWLSVSPDEAKQLSEALYALGARPRKPGQ